MNKKHIEWKKVRIKDLCSLSRGFKKVPNAKDDGKYDFFSCSQEVKKIDTFTKQGVAIVFPCVGCHCAKLVFFVKTNIKFDLTMGAICLDSFNETLIYPKFLLQWLKINFYSYVTQKGLVVNTTVRSISGQTVKNIELLIPTCLNYQKKVAGFLELQISDINKLLKLYAAQIEIAKKLKNTLINYYTNNFWKHVDKTGWIKVRIKDLCSLSIGKKAAIDAKEDGKYDFYSGSKEVKKTNSFSMCGPAILISGVGRLCGRVIHWSKSGNKFDCTNNAQTLIDFKSQLINPLYLYHWFKANFYGSCLKKGLITVTTIPMLSINNIKNMELLIPRDLSEQKRLLKQLEDNEDKKNKLTDLSEAFIRTTKKTIDALKGLEIALIQELTTPKDESRSECFLNENNQSDIANKCF